MRSSSLVQFGPRPPAGDSLTGKYGHHRLLQEVDGDQAFPGPGPGRGLVQQNAQEDKKKYIEEEEEDGGETLTYLEVAISSVATCRQRLEEVTRHEAPSLQLLLLQQSDFLLPAR